MTCHELPARFWPELHMVPFIFRRYRHNAEMDIHEEVDEIVRKRVMSCNPNMQLRLQIGFWNEVGVDAGVHCHLITIKIVANR